MNAKQITELADILKREPTLEWKPANLSVDVADVNTYDAVIGEPDDGVHFSLQYCPTCYRRGPWRLLVSVNGGPGHHKWGCFDIQDQPMRWYHMRKSLTNEADEIAKVLIIDRVKEGPTNSFAQNTHDINTINAKLKYIKPC